MIVKSPDMRLLAEDVSLELEDDLGTAFDLLGGELETAMEDSETLEAIERMLDGAFEGPQSFIMKELGTGIMPSIYSTILMGYADALGCDPQELAAGTAEELEHTTDWAVAMKIAIDHLKEDKAYYIKLKAAGLMKP